ncbi:MAG: hypothetical protein KDK48_06155, partial [Chlamydiia bacterium]|nr:hypothetical protein [Chlamydiia bacterium]
AVDCLTRPLVERRTINSLLSYAIVVVLASAAVATVSSVALLVIFGLPVELISVAVTVPVFMSYTTLLRLPLELVVAFNDVTHHTFEVSPRKMARQFEELVKLAPEGVVSLDFEKEIKSKIEALQTIVSPAEAKDALRDIRIAVGETMLPCKFEGSTKEYHRCYGKFLDSLRQLE